MGNRVICRKKSGKIPIQKKEQNLYSRIQSVAAEEIMKKSAWFIDKEEIDNYFSKEELLFYRRNHQYSKKISEMMIIPSKPAEIRFFKQFFINLGINSGEKKFRWREGEVIGQGAFGEVIMGFNEDNGQIMAVKQVNLKFLQSEEVKKFFFIKNHIGRFANL